MGESNIGTGVLKATFKQIDGSVGGLYDAVLRVKSEDIHILRKYSPFGNVDRGHTGHICDASYAINDCEECYPLEIYATSEAKVKEAVGKLEELTGILLERID